MPIHAHVLVAQTAEEMAKALFETMCQDNAWYKAYRAVHGNSREPLKVLRKFFVKEMAPKLLEDARATLAQMLATSSDEALKNTIAEALILDNSLKGHREGPLAH